MSIIKHDLEQKYWQYRLAVKKYHRHRFRYKSIGNVDSDTTKVTPIQYHYHRFGPLSLGYISQLADTVVGYFCITFLYFLYSFFEIYSVLCL